MNLGRAFDAANQADSAIAMFERYRDTHFFERHLVPNDPIHLAAVHKRLGELYEARGERAKAAAAYAKFTELWKTRIPTCSPWSLRPERN